MDFVPRFDTYQSYLDPDFFNFQGPSYPFDQVIIGKHMNTFDQWLTDLQVPTDMTTIYQP